MHFLHDIVSLDEFENNKSNLLESVKSTKRPLVLTVDGHAEFVVVDADAYRKREAQVEHFECVEAIKQGIADLEAGGGEEAHVVFAELERKFPFLKPSR